MRLHRFSLVILGLAFLVAPALATDLGDDAPPLKVEKWLKGGPIDLKDGKGRTIYVVEFWATWCPPCRTSIPHLTEVQKEFKDKNVVVIGVSTDSEKTRAAVKPFVDKMGAKMEYAVALDTEDKAANKAYMAAFNVGGIPNAFVIDTKGKIVWQGHPMVGLEEVLDAVVGGKYDVKSLAEISRKLEEEAEKLGKLMEEYFTAVSASTDAKGAAEIGAKILELAKKNAMALNQFAWTILAAEEIKARDLKLALQAGKAAYDACKGQDPAIVDTYARALFDNGQVKEAIEQQKKAIELAGDSKEMKTEFEKTLQWYQVAAKKQKP